MELLKKNNKHINCIIIAILSPIVFWAQKVSEADTTAINVKRFSEDLQKNYSGSDFDYVTNDTGGTNLLQEILRKFFNWLGNIIGFDTSWMDMDLVEYAIYALFAIIIVYLIIKYMLNSPVNTIFNKEDRKINTLNFTEENIEKVDFDKLISKAVEEANFRVAVRYLYLKSLQLLSNHQIIEWHFDKTNAEYQSEIKDATTKEYFRKVSYIYDYVWYGEFSIDESDYEKTAYNFNKLNQSVR